MPLKLKTIIKTLFDMGKMKRDNSPNHILVPALGYDCMVWQINRLESQLELIKKKIDPKTQNVSLEVSTKNMKKYYSPFISGANNRKSDDLALYLQIPRAFYNRLVSRTKYLESQLELIKQSPSNKSQ